MWSLKTPELTETEQINGCQRRVVGARGGGRCGGREGGQKVQTASYKINTFWGWIVQHGNYS